MGQDGMPKGESNMFVYDASQETGKPLTTHQHYDGTQRPWEFKRVWHLEPSLTDPDTVYAGVEDAALFRSTNGGKTWQELAGLRDAKGSLWQPGAGGMCLHTIMLDRSNPERIFIAISAAGAFRTDDAGKTWKPINRGLKSQYGCPIRRLKSATVSIVSRCIRRARTCCTCKSTGMSCGATMRAGPGTRSAETSRPILGFPSTCMPMNQKPFTSSRSRAIQNIFLPMASCAFIGAVPEGTSGKR